MRTLDRYLIREIVPPFLLSLLAFTFILEIPPIMDVAERLIAKGVGGADVVRIMITLLPQALGVTIPMALLIGLLIGLGRLNADRELVVMQACGVSLYRLLVPVFILGALACAATAYVMIVALPDANQAFREITYRIVASRAEHEVRPRIFFEDFPSRLIYVREVPAEGGWHDVFMADTSMGASPDVYVARRGRIVLDRERRKVEMSLEDGTRHRLLSQAASQPEKYEVLQFERMSFALDPDSVFPRTGPQRGAQELSIADLQAQIKELEASGNSPHPPIMVIHRKFSIPAACLVFALIGLALGVSNRKDGKLASFVLGVGVIFAYYVTMYMAESLAKGLLISAHLAMWVPNVVLGVFGVLLLRRRRRVPGRSLLSAIRFPRMGWGRNKEAAAAARPAQTPGNGWRVRVTFPRLWLPRFNILDGYVIRLYLRIFALTAVGLLGIFYISTFIDLSDKLFKGQTTGAMMARYFWYATPQFIYFVLPLATLISTLVAIGLLTKNSELVVMKACGISLYRVGAPLVLFGALWSGVLFGLEESLLAHANRRAEETRHVIRGGSPQTFNVLNRKWIVSRSGDIYHYLFFDPQKAELNGLSTYRLDQKTWRLTSRSFANKATYTKDGWQASDGWIRSFSPDDQSTYAAFQTSALALEPPEYFLTEQPDADRMTYPQLKRYIDELQSSGFNVVPQLVLLHRKLSFPFVTVIMTLLAVPFAVTTGSRGALYGVGVGLVLALVYWTLISVFGAIGSAGLIAPPLAAWTPNILFLAGAGILVLSAKT